MAMLERAEVEALGFAGVGRDVEISERAVFYGASRITLGDAVRIDDFCVVSAGAGGIAIGSHVHLAVGCTLIGAARISLEDFSGLSSRVSVYSSSDDYSGAALTNPTVPDCYRAVVHGEVRLGRHAIVGAGSVILPGVTLEEGVAVGALSLVTKRCAAFGVYAGRPARRVKERSRELLRLEAALLGEDAPR
ncbi:acyltransferase [Marichromatium gracile]|uniref:Galactoside O-acetyltransferase n=1 Tax=Marichromatium gracile TaxID=1048 RepID=A0A4R4AJT9_MARGR|nr:acyltransferase [Marichromatium gracile]MBK1709915.1 galactoside O-acetyltransferase [Marichromatium gracile]TCW39668.1 galactoside O-acetyltransferase [Marichromatium gracile]